MRECHLLSELITICFFGLEFILERKGSGKWKREIVYSVFKVGCRERKEETNARQEAKQTSPLHQTVNSEVVCSSWNEFANKKEKWRKRTNDVQDFRTWRPFRFTLHPSFLSRLLFILVILSHGRETRTQSCKLSSLLVLFLYRRRYSSIN